jgi:hypothetical protein
MGNFVENTLTTLDSGFRILELSYLKAFANPQIITIE